MLLCKCYYDYGTTKNCFWRRSCKEEIVIAQSGRCFFHPIEITSPRQDESLCKKISWHNINLRNIFQTTTKNRKNQQIIQQLIENFVEI